MKSGIDRSEMIRRLFLQEKPVEILISISRMETPYASRILREVDTTFAHAVKILSTMEDLGIIESERSGRIKALKLTPHGEVLAESLNNFLEACKVDSDAEAEKIRGIAERILSRLDQIYREEIEGKKRLKHRDMVRISRRIAPYERELKRLERMSGGDKETYILEIKEKIAWIKREKEQITSS
ncbi:MAG TPA: hypothetical protein ENG09_04635 [Candidatus Syntrophoarchaeum butanivorans]|uniref:MarR family transcriptional regulator n=1 Tax=Candidatus Syntropharchaeum butanivorans TaxID=1839936 RepID=A0A7C1B3Z1_9EURY|nr:hypothetical protein [Candidatus Syntrophoarchaeum butanivorans]